MDTFLFPGRKFLSGRSHSAPPDDNDADAVPGCTFQNPNSIQYGAQMPDGGDTGDKVGPDVELAIEEHYASIRPELPVGPRELLKRYVREGRLGWKTGEGFYTGYQQKATAVG